MIVHKIMGILHKLINQEYRKGLKSHKRSKQGPPITIIPKQRELKENICALRRYEKLTICDIRGRLREQDPEKWFFYKILEEVKI